MGGRFSVLSEYFLGTRITLQNFVTNASAGKYHIKLLNIETFNIFAEMDRKILTYGGYFERFMERLGAKEQEKVKYGLLLLK